MKAWDRDLSQARARRARRPHAGVRVRARARATFGARCDRLGVGYPVALDNDYATWNAFQNQYWPAKYLIDRNGHLRYYHFGEGEYDTTEARIRTLLGESAGMLPVANRLSDRTPRTRHDAGDVPRVRAPRAVRPGHGSRRTASPTTDFPDRELAAERARLRGPVAGGGRGDRRGARRPAAAALHGAKGAPRSRRARATSASCSTGSRCASSASTEAGSTRCSTLPELTNGLLELRFDPGVRGYAFTFG